jgi:hypothetical protein
MGGKDDPKLCLLRCDPADAEIWKDASSIVAGVKLFLGMGDPKEGSGDSEGLSRSPPLPLGEDGASAGTG